jgi:hypothetical protein
MTTCQCSTPGLCINLSLNQMQGQRLKSRHPQFAVTCGNLWYCIEAVLGLFWYMEPKLKTENWCLAQPKSRSNRTWRKHIETPSILGCAPYFWWNLVGDTPYPLVPLLKIHLVVGWSHWKYPHCAVLPRRCHQGCYGICCVSRDGGRGSPWPRRDWCKSPTNNYRWWYPLVNVYITMENHHAING